MPIIISEVLTKDFGFILEMIFTLRSFLVLKSFCSLEDLGVRNGFLFEPMGLCSLTFPLNSY